MSDNKRNQSLATKKLVRNIALLLIGILAAYAVTTLLL